MPVSKVTLAKAKLPAPHGGQQTVQLQARRFNWLSAGRRWRKTTLVMAIAVEAAAVGKKIIWGAPVYDQARVGWNETRKAAEGVAEFNETRMEANFPRSGGQILYRSLDDPANVRGHTADGVVMDECGTTKAAAWREALRPMLIDTGGWAWGVGTPNGTNWFWEEFMAAVDYPDSIAWQAPTLGVTIVDGQLVRTPHPLENPNIKFAEMQRLWQTMPADTFRQEILAEFMADSGAVFRRITEACVAVAQTAAQPYHEYVFGFDSAKRGDFTVITVIDTATRELVYMDRFNQIEYVVQIDRLAALCARFQPSVVMVEETGNLALVEMIRRATYKTSDGSITNIPVWAFTTSNASKGEIIQALALAFEQSDIKILDDRTLKAELMAFTMERLPSGAIRYGAPENQHDDTVLSLALAWSQVRRMEAGEQLPAAERARRKAYELIAADSPLATADVSRNYHQAAFLREEQRAERRSYGLGALEADDEEDRGGHPGWAVANGEDW